MPIVKPIKLVTAGGLGLLDVGLEYLDEQQGWKEPFRKSADIARAIQFGGGMIGYYMMRPGEGFLADAIETMITSSERVLIKDIANLVKGLAASPKGKGLPPGIKIKSPPMTLPPSPPAQAPTPVEKLVSY